MPSLHTVRRAPARPRVARRRVATVLALALLAMGLAIPALVASDSSSEVPVGFASNPAGDGFWVVWPNGKVEAKGQATTYGDATTVPLREQVVGIASTKSGKGYWLVAADGGIFSFGDARFFGSTGGMRLNQPMTGIAATSSGNGYWLVASDGGVFSFGDAGFFGSTGSIHLNAPISGIAATRSGGGYWLAAIDGGVFAFGDAPFIGSAGGTALNSWIRGVTPTETGRGYWLAGIDGSVFAYGDAATGAHTPVVVGVIRAGNGWTFVMSNAPASVPSTKPLTKPTTPTTPKPTTPTTPKPTTPTTVKPPPPPPPPPPANTVMPPNSVDRTGTRDVTAELQAFLNKVPHHSTIAFPAGSWYRIEGTLSMSNRNDIHIAGNGAVFFATQASVGTDNPRTRSQFDFSDMSNLVIEGMIIRGAHPNGGQDASAYVAELEAQHGINIFGGERIEIRNMRITDVYGDFIYVGRSSHPLFGKPMDVSIHDNYFRRNGRQGVAVTHGFNVVLERNDIGDTRRATFDLEPASENGSVRNVWIRNNKVGPGRLLFVAGHGAGDVSDVYIQNNVLTGRNMGVSFVSPAPAMRQNIVVTGNVSDTAVGNGAGDALRFVGYNYIDVRNNRQPMQAGRDMYMVGIMRTCKATVSGNDIPNGVGQLLYLQPPIDCSTVPPLTPPIRPTMFEGQNLKIDVGGAGGAGVIPCPTPKECGGFYTGAAATPITAAGGGTLQERTMLHGNLAFDIPIRSGSYNVTLTWIEPTADISDRRFHLNMDAEVRRESGFDVNRAAGGKNKVVRRTYSVPVGDGVLDITTMPGGTGANGPILSFIEINRA
jgi:hypothetical protein